MKQLTNQQRRIAIERLTRLGYQFGDYRLVYTIDEPTKQPEQNKTNEPPRP